MTFQDIMQLLQGGNGQLAGAGSFNAPRGVAAPQAPQGPHIGPAAPQGGMSVPDILNLLSKAGPLLGGPPQYQMPQAPQQPQPWRQPSIGPAQPGTALPRAHFASDNYALSNPLAAAIGQRSQSPLGPQQPNAMAQFNGAAQHFGQPQSGRPPSPLNQVPQGPQFQLPQERPTAQGLQGFDGYGQAAPLTPPPPPGVLPSQQLGLNATGPQAALPGQNFQQPQQGQNPVVAFLRALGHLR